ncbi:DUF2291 family protein [candidate division KSB1 bacterium]|nr:DUF2291 family protein [candidate division KSB1 bacterium]
MCRIAKKIAFALIVVFVLANSIYFQSLHDRQNQRSVDFEPAQYAASFWEELQGELYRAVDASELLHYFATDMKTAVERYGRTLGLSRSHSYLVKGAGVIMDITDDALLISLQPAPNAANIALATAFLFGNEIRDGAGIVNVSDFPSTMEFNTISVAINKIVSEEILPPVLKTVKRGDSVHFVGATTVNEETPDIHPLRVVPVSLELKGE